LNKIISGLQCERLSLLLVMFLKRVTDCSLPSCTSVELSCLFAVCLVGTIKLFWGGTTCTNKSLLILIGLRVPVPAQFTVVCGDTLDNLLGTFTYLSL
jgi:hypothetical protein